MNKSEQLLNIIKWENAEKNVFIDIDRAFAMMYRRKYSPDEMLFSWKYIAEKKPFLAYLLLNNYKDKGVVCNPREILEEIWKSVVESTEISEKKLSDALVISSITGKNLSYHFIEEIKKSEDKENICKEAFKVIETINDREKNVLILLKTLHKYIGADDIEGALANGHYQFSRIGIENELIDFTTSLIDEGSFVLAYIITKIYGLDYSELKVNREQIYNSLRQCDNHNYFRGCLVYKNYVTEETEIDALKKWYSDLLKIRSEIAQDEIAGLKLIFLCQALQVSSREPDELLKEIQININNLPAVEMNRKQYIREYRRTVKKLILSKNISWCKFFLERTAYYNIDRYESKETSRWPYPRNVRQHIGYRDENELMNIFLNTEDEIADKIYVYMNSFMRGIVTYNEFTERMYEKYGDEVIGELKKYYISGYVLYDQVRDIFYLKSNNVMAKAKFFIDQESADIIKVIGTDNSGAWFQTVIKGYNPESKVYKFLIPGFGEQRLDGICKALEKFEYNQEMTDYLLELIDKTNISLVNRETNEFVDLCIRILGTIVSCCGNREKLYEILEYTSKINYYLYKENQYNDLARNLSGIRPEQYRQIRIYWKQLFNSKLDVMDCFNIYRNTILRRMYGLSEFLEKFVEDSRCGYSDFFSIIGSFVGKVQVFAKSRKNEDCMALFVAPSEFKLTNKNRSEEKKYDQFLIEVPLYGESVRSASKSKGIQKGTVVYFEIESYNGKGMFFVKNLRFKI